MNQKLSLMNIDKYIIKLSEQAVHASTMSGSYSTTKKNSVLYNISKNLDINTNKIIKSNNIDIRNAQKKGLSDSMIDRLVLNKQSIISMCEGLAKIIKIPDSVYRTTKSVKQKSGIMVSQMRVPLGVIGIIYESRPNVTIDAAGLCLKSGNSVILPALPTFSSRSKLNIFFNKRFDN